MNVGQAGNQNGLVLDEGVFFLYFRRYYSFIETYSIRYDKTLLYIFMSRCDNILILPVLPAFEPNRIALRFHLKYS